ncbi:MAG: DUF211 domain-containing protein [Methermicoccaceae archaeon]
MKRLVLDVLKPHQPLVIEIAESISDLVGVEGVNLTLYEVDQETENIKVTIEGDKLDYYEIRRVINELGGVVHSIDEVVAGRRMVEEVETHQD